MNDFKKLVLVMTGLLAATVSLAGCWVYYPYHPLGTAIITTAHRPPATYDRQPRVELIAGTTIYWTPSLGRDVFRYNGSWYWCDGPNWYRASMWGGNWVHVLAPPRVFLSIPSHHNAFHVTFRHPQHRKYISYRRQHYSASKYTKPARTVPFSAVSARERSKKGVAPRKGVDPRSRASQEKGAALRRKLGTSGKPTRPSIVRPGVKPPRNKPTRPSNVRPGVKPPPTRVTPPGKTPARRQLLGGSARTKAAARRAKAKAAEEERRKKRKK